MEQKFLIEIENFVNNSKKFQILKEYVALVFAYNKRINLTSLKIDEFWIKGVYGSLVFYQNLNLKNQKEFLDLGSGSGIPIIPHLILNPMISVTIIEKSFRKSEFLKLASKILSLNIKVINNDVNFVDAEKFDVISCQAVSNFKNIFLMTQKFGKNNTLFAFVKGKNAWNEVEAARNHINEKVKNLEINKINAMFNLQVFAITYNLKF